MSTRGGRASRRLLAVPVAGAVATVAALVAAVLMLAGVLGGAAAGASCTGATLGPSPVPGAPAELQPIFDAAARHYQLGPRGAAILAGLTSVESGFGQNMGPSSAGAIGWTQFMPATWAAYGVDANGDGRKDPYTAEDAIFASARYLKASGAPGDWYRALFAYNHADWYVTKVLERSEELTAGTAAGQPVSGPRPSVLVVGDSLAVGTVPELEEMLGGPVTSDVLGGRSSSAGITALRRVIRGGDYDVIVFDHGTNDATATELRRSLADLARLARDRQLVIATVNSPWAERAKNALLRDFAQTHENVTLIPWQEESQRLDLPDGIHGGYETRARLIAEALNVSSAPANACHPAGIATDVQRVEDGGVVVPIPGQPGQLIDERILNDVVYLTQTYRLTITAGYDLTGHAANGEHPLGLALDIVPGPGGSWDDVDHLARWAEPTQNAPRPPFRWVGYDGDANHGRGHHLHLSWNHGPAPSQRPPAPWVQTFRPAR